MRNEAAPSHTVTQQVATSGSASSPIAPATVQTKRQELESADEEGHEGKKMRNIADATVQNCMVSDLTLKEWPLKLNNNHTVVL